MRLIPVSTETTVQSLKDDPDRPLDIYDAFNGADQKSYQEHLDTICGLSASIAEAQQYFPVIVGEFAL